MSVAVASRKIAFVLLIDGHLKEWQHSRAGGLSPTKGRSFLRMAIARYEPNLVVMENPYALSRKYGMALSIMTALVQELEDCGMPHYRVCRHQSFANKYEEAETLVERHPEIAPWLPDNPKLWEREPTDAIHFEALALYHQALDGAPSSTNGPSAS